jgi:hypothetical protein
VTYSQVDEDGLLKVNDDKVVKQRLGCGCPAGSQDRGLVLHALDSGDVVLALVSAQGAPFLADLELAQVARATKGALGHLGRRDGDTLVVGDAGEGREGIALDDLLLREFLTLGDGSCGNERNGPKEPTELPGGHHDGRWYLLVREEEKKNE